MTPDLNKKDFSINNGTDCFAILRAETSIIYVRAPVDFALCALSAAVTLPLMNDA